MNSGVIPVESFSWKVGPLLLRDEVNILLKKEGKIIKQFQLKGKTWKNAGLNLCRDALILSAGVTERVNTINVYAAGNNFYSSSNSKPAAEKGRFYASIPASGAINNITRFDLYHNTTQYATIAVASFDKPDGLSLEITWDTDFSSGFYGTGGNIPRDATVEGVTLPVNQMRFFHSGGSNDYLTTGYAPSAGLARFMTTVPTGVTLTNIATIRLRATGGPQDVMEETMTAWDKGGAVSLEVQWDSQLS